MQDDGSCPKLTTRAFGERASPLRGQWRSSPVERYGAHSASNVVYRTSDGKMDKQSGSFLAGQVGPPGHR
ncbi:hypothetical protein HBB16_17480 [Pseudonocardia sp. MCCB 268]|nr:hypothetical protein [Pseudonocardia cytotoxica]